MNAEKMYLLINELIDDVSKRIHDHELDFKTARAQGFSDGCLTSIYKSISFERGKAEAYREIYLLIKGAL